MDQKASSTFDQVQVTRADHYVHEADAWSVPVGDGVFQLRDDAGIVKLAVDRVGVDHDVVETGRVTLSARGSDPLDGYGYEFDLTPSGARRLARLLQHAARMAGSGHTGHEVLP